MVMLVQRHEENHLLFSCYFIFISFLQPFRYLHIYILQICTYTYLYQTGNTKLILLEICVYSFPKWSTVTHLMGRFDVGFRYWRFFYWYFVFFELSVFLSVTAFVHLATCLSLCCFTQFLYAAITTTAQRSFFRYRWSMVSCEGDLLHSPSPLPLKYGLWNSCLVGDFCCRFLPRVLKALR